MKKTLWRVLALCLSLIMIVSCFAACDKDGGKKDDDKDNIYLSVQEEGTEEELTAVREDLIKAAETKGFGDIDKMEFYENGVRTTSSTYVQVKDNKKFYYSGDTKRLVNYADGYILDMPADWKPDFSMSTMRCRFDTDEVSLIASREDDGIAYHGGVEEYFAALYLYLKNEDFQKNNKVTVIEDIPATKLNDDWQYMVYRVKLEDCAEGTKCYYTYVDYFNDLNQTYHFMFKAVDDRDFADVYKSFQGIYDKGAPVDTRLFPCIESENWSEETTTFYQNLKEQDHIDWGLFSYRLQSTGIEITIPMLEKKLDFEFPIISEYIHYSNPFPVDFAKQMMDDGRMMQISYQFTLNNNSDLTFQNPILDIYRKTDESKQVLTEFAEGAAQMGQPFYFRLNNEMNTDWTSYCAMANMLDPDIFVDTWITLYDIFTETGANQYALWVFNGFDKSYPPYKWANYQCYMPPSEYIHMIGLTGYNFVTEEDTSSWRTFEQIYDEIYTAYEPHFAEWPWIISEFGCETSTAEDQSKAQWITDMFTTLDAGKYPQLKVAIWFNCSDYDTNGKVTNDLNLEKDPEVVEAFKAGLELTQP